MKLGTLTPAARSKLPEVMPADVTYLWLNDDYDGPVRGMVKVSVATSERITITQAGRHWPRKR